MVWYREDGDAPHVHLARLRRGSDVVEGREDLGEGKGPVAAFGGPLLSVAWSTTDGARRVMVPGTTDTGGRPWGLTGGSGGRPAVTWARDAVLSIVSLAVDGDSIALTWKSCQAGVCSIEFARVKSEPASNRCGGASP